MFIQIRRSKINIGSRRGERIAIVTTSQASSIIALFKKHDPDFQYWTEPFELGNEELSAVAA